MYGELMLKCVERCKVDGIITKNLVKTIKYIREQLYSIDASPRLATLTLFLQYNLPNLEQHSEWIWNNLFTTEKYESQIKS